MNDKFDICLMNPPYGNHGHGIDETFLEKAINLSKIVCTVQPLSWLIALKQNKDIVKYVDEYGINIENTNAMDSFDVGIIGLNAIQFIDTTKKSDIIYNGIKYSKCSDIKSFSNDNYFVEFAEKIHYENEVTNSLQDNLNKNSENGRWYLEVPKLRGHKNNNGKLADFYTIISNNDEWLFSNKVNKISDETSKSIIYFTFNSKQEVYNFVNYLKTDFVRACLFLTKFNMNLLSGRMFRSIPYFDFSQAIFSKTPSEIDDYLFKKYDISDDIRKHIEEILPDYYGIRKH